MEYVIKPNSERWDGGYFRNTVLSKHVIPFLNNPNKVGGATLLHDRAPCMKALQTQALQNKHNVDFFSEIRNCLGIHLVNIF